MVHSMGQLSILSKILAPVSVQDFVYHYFLRRPLLIKGDMNKFKFMFHVNSFKENLDKVDHIRAIFPLLRQATIQISDMPDMIRAGASICVTGVQNGNEILSSAIDRIKDEL